MAQRVREDESAPEGRKQQYTPGMEVEDQDGGENPLHSIPSLSDNWGCPSAILVVLGVIGLLALVFQI